MNFTKLVTDKIGEVIQANIFIADSMAQNINDAGHKVIGAITLGNKIFCCDIQETMFSEYMGNKLLKRVNINRPPLPIIPLSSQVISILKQGDSLENTIVNQINTLGNKGDVLIILVTNDEPNVISEIIKTAHEKEILIITITGKNNSKVLELIKKNDINIYIPSERNNCIHEVQLVIINCLCEIIDKGLFGI